MLNFKENMASLNRWQFMVLLLLASVLIVRCGKGESYEEEGGESHGGDHHEDESHKGEKGEHSHHEDEKGEKGDYDKEDSEHHFDEVIKN